MAQRNGSVKRAAKTARQATATAETMTDRVTNQARKIADQTITSAEERLEAAQEMTAKYINDGRAAMSSASDMLRNYVSERPIQALSLAVGAGMLLSFCIRRR